MNEEFINRLKELASSDSWTDEIFSESITLDNFACGNVDDAFRGGHESGQIELARDVLSALNIKWYAEE